jgi:hypothetical protein
MAENDDEVIAPTPASIKALAEDFEGWAKDLDWIIGKVDFAEISPGSTKEGKTLKKQWETLRTTISTNMKEASKSFHTISSELIIIGDKYTHTDNLNKDDVERLRHLIDALDKFIDDPALDTILPSKDNPYTPPPEPDPEPDPDPPKEEV